MSFEGYEEKGDYYESNFGILYSPNINNFSYDDLNNHFNLCDQLADAENKNELDPFMYNKSDDLMAQLQHEKKTSYTTNNKNIIRKKYSNLEPPKILDNVEIKTDVLPTLYSFDDIEKIFTNNDYKEKFIFDVNQVFIKNEKLEEPYLNKKRRRDSNFENCDLYEIFGNEKLYNSGQENKLKRGRKPKDLEGWGGHDRMSSDNIIKKIKAKFFNYMTTFLNKIANTTTSEEGNKIKRLDYRFINQLNREIDLKFLNMPLKDLFSLDISPKYRKESSNANKINIEKILNENPDEAIKFVFNMTFRDWLDVFSYKKTVKELLNEKNIYNDDICEKIEKSLNRVDKLLNKLAKNENKDYFSNLTFYLYNYEIWFFKKRGRKTKKGNNQNENSEK